MRKILQSFILLLFVATTSLAQQRIITGTITGSDDGNPIPGVTIRVANTKTGVQSAGNGTYSIALTAGAATLQFSSIGYETKTVTVGTANTLNIVLSPNANNLDDVIVVAYGTAKKESFTGSASVVKAGVIADRPITSFEKALQGAASGVTVSSVSGQPGAASTVRIRGVGSISASSTPLYVIDGVVITTGDLSQVATTTDVLSSLNPNDIESVTVLKDAAASSIYGSRAANGVILVTTKKGLNGATKFNASITAGYQSIAVKKHETLDASQYYKLYFDSYYNTNIAAGQTAAAAATAANASTIRTLAVNPYNTTTPLGAGGTLNPGAALYYDTDWRDAVLDRGVTKDVNVSAQGGNEKTKFFISGGYFDQKGIVLASDFTRYSSKINISNQVNKWMNFGVNTSLSYTEQNTPAGSGGGANPVRFSDLVSNVYSLYQRNASGQPVVDASGNNVYNYVNPIANDFNPVGLAEKDTYLTKTARALVNPYVEVSFLKDFKARSSFSADYINNRESLFYNTEHGNGANVKGRAARYTVQTMTLQITNTLNWSHRFGLHNVSALIGQEAYKDHYDNISTAKTGFPFAGVEELIAGSTPVTASSYYTDSRLSSLFSRVNYDYNNRYYFTGSVRRDGSSVFGADTKFGTFYALGASWRLTQENFLKDVSWLSELKLKASYGTSGNNRIDRYASQGLYALGSNYEGLPGITYSQLANADLRWESSKQTDIGVEFSLLKGRINGDVSYYNRGSEGLLYSQPLSFTTGFASITNNLASIYNRGFDFSLNGDAIRTDNFSWNVSWNLTTTKNKIKSILNGQQINGTKILKEGGDVYQFYLREYAGVDPADGAPLWYVTNTDGTKTTTKTYNSSTRYASGSSLPKFTGGLTNSFTYKQFDLSLFLFYSQGGKIYDSLYQSLMHGGNVSGQQLSVDVYNSWKNPGDITDVPKFAPVNTALGNSQSTRFLFDGSYIRVKNIQLGYNLNQEWAKKAGLSTARLFVLAENPFTFAKHKGMDPETDITGLNDSDVPNIKSISLGLKLGF
jgi:TonB-linked SusC/RagA family outer membrane protein